MIKIHIGNYEQIKNNKYWRKPAQNKYCIYLTCSIEITENNLEPQLFDLLNRQQTKLDHQDKLLQLPTAGTLVEVPKKVLCE